MSAIPEADRDPLGQSRLLSSGYRSVFIAVMLIVCLFNFADRAVFAVLGQTIKRELGLSDAQYGLLAGPSFAFLYAIAGLPINSSSSRHGSSEREKRCEKRKRDWRRSDASNASRW